MQNFNQFMLLIVILHRIVQGALIIPNKPFQLCESQWVYCDQLNQQYKLDFNKLNQQNYFIDNRSICSKNITFDIQNKYLYYYFVFAQNVQNQLTISINSNKYSANLKRLQNTKTIVILNTHDGEQKLSTDIRIEGKYNYFQQLYIFQLDNNETQIINKILYNDVDKIINPLDNQKLEKIKLLSLESNILQKKFINLQFNFEFHKLEQLLCHFNILKYDNITIQSLNDSIIDLSSQLEIKSEYKYRNIDFILRVQSYVEIAQIFGGNNLDYTYPFDLIIQTDGQNNFIQTIINQSNEKMKLFSEISILNFVQNSTLFIEIKPQGIQCPTNLSMTLINLQIKNNDIQWSYLEEGFLQNCQIYIEHSIIKEGVYYVEVNVEIISADLTFYLENSGQFSIYQFLSIETHLEMVLIVYFGSIIFFICIFIVLLRKCDVIIFSKWDSLYFKTIFMEVGNQNGQQQ